MSAYTINMQSQYISEMLILQGFSAKFERNFGENEENFLWRLYAEVVHWHKGTMPSN
jgi:hypothetical protein